MATIPSSREGVATAVKNDQASDVHLVENLSRIREDAGTAAKPNQTYLKFISEIIMIKGPQLINRLIKRRPCFIPMDLSKETVFFITSDILR